MIHYFNPGHETASLNASKHYHPPAHVAKMQNDLAFLPAWYATKGDYVFVSNPLPEDYILSCNPFDIQVGAITPEALNSKPETRNSAIDLWGISLNSIYFFEKLGEQFDLELEIPRWKGEFSYFGSRFASQKLLAMLLERIPELDKEILPYFVSDIEVIEQFTIQSKDTHLVKSPYSSSGRGLVWLPPGELHRSERQILGGMLKKQKQVSIEKALHKYLDFSIQYEITKEKEVCFIGYSIFQTNAKGAYEKSLLGHQELMKQQITNLIGDDLLQRVQSEIKDLLSEMYAPYYTGIVGVDMLIYRSDNIFCLYPCVEINMRKNMGFLAIRLTERYIHPCTQGEFCIDFHSDSQKMFEEHKLSLERYPPVFERGRLRRGYFNLCPVTAATNFRAYIRVCGLEF